MNRQTLTYKGLARLMYGQDAAGVLNRILGHVAYYCLDQELPPLTSIVVGKGRGTPGQDIPMDLQKRDSERERVYETDWYDIYPPHAKELAECYANHSVWANGLARRHSSCSIYIGDIASGRVYH